jgi:hypothetical protein
MRLIRQHMAHLYKQGERVAMWLLAGDEAPFGPVMLVEAPMLDEAFRV